MFADGYIYDGEHDAIKLSYGDKWYVSGAYGKLTDLNEDAGNYSKKFWTAEIGSNIEDSFVNGKVGYLRTKLGENGETDYDRDNVGIFYVGADFKVAKDLDLGAMYLHTNADKFNGENGYDTTKKNGFVVGLGYKGAEASEPGSWGLAARYYHQGKGTYLAHTIDGYTDFKSGFKGWSVGGDVTLAKNMVLGVTYYDTKALKDEMEQADLKKARVLWSELNITF